MEHHYFRINDPFTIGMLLFEEGTIVRAIERNDRIGDALSEKWTVKEHLVNDKWTESPFYGITEGFVEKGQVTRLSKEEAEGPEESPKLIFNPFQIRETAAIIAQSHHVNLSQQEVAGYIYQDIAWLSGQEQIDVDETSRYGYLVKKSLMTVTEEGDRVLTFDVLINAGVIAGIEFVEGQLDSEGNIVVQFPSGLG